MHYNDWMKYLANSLAKYKAKREGKLRFIGGASTDHLCLCESAFCPYCDCYEPLPGITWIRKYKKIKEEV